jgi:poly-gamma-glutamate synthesis protein (capsule biosynthesis protein)
MPAVKGQSLLQALAVLGAAVVITIVALLLVPAVQPGQPVGTETPRQGAGAATTEPTANTAALSASPAGPPAATPSPTPTPTLVSVAVVPVTHFRSTAEATNLREVRAVLAGASKRYEAIELVRAEEDAVLATLGVARPSDPSRLVLADDAASLTAELASSRKRLGFLRADAVGPSVRALAWGQAALFGVDRLTEPGEWPLTAELPAGTAPDTFDPAAIWTLFAGGDILLDRGVYKTVVLDKKGVDFPFDGGTAEITRRYCCSSFGWELPRTRRTGDAGAVRDLIDGADLAIANFENPAPNRPRYHTHGTVFTADPALIDGLANAGIDYVSIANNHIRDAGGQGLLQTIANVEKRGIQVSGAGRDLAAAREPARLEAGGQTVAILAYDAIAAVYHATTDRIGSAPLSASIVRADVKAARAGGADVVIVFPHWGAEYRSKPFAAQQKLARMIVDSGADLVIGNHAHWAAALEIYKGRPIWYALGNFVFDQTWSEPTMEGITLELTFSGSELVQARMRPHIILDRSQPNFLDPADDGNVVMGQVYGASKGLLPW